MAYIGRQLVRGQNRVLDDISSSFNGSTTAFNLTVSSSSSPPASVNQLWIILGGILQKPGTDFTVADAVITFTTAPASTLNFWGMIQGDTSDINSPADASVTPSKIANSGDFAFPADVRFNDADGSHYVGLQAPSTVSSNLVWTLPAADGSANQLLKTDGSGALGWATDGNTTLTGSTNNTITTVTGANAIQGEAKLTFNGAGDLTVTGDEGTSANLYLIADEGDDNGDGWRVGSNQDANDLTFANNTSGSYADKLTLTSGGTLECNNIKILTVNSFESSANVFEGKGTNGARLRSALSSASTPSFSNSDDTDTGMFLPGSDVIGFTTGGAERARIESSGKFLIERTVSDTSGDHPALQVKTTSSGTENASFATGIDFYQDSIHKKRLAITKGNAGTGGGDWVFYENNGTTRQLELIDGGNVEISDGNLVIGTSGHGIDFSAAGNDTTNATSTGALLSDYEEGTFSPTLKSNGAANTYPEQSYAVNTGYYTRVGRICHVTFDIQMGSSITSGSNYCVIANLPFKIFNSNNARGVTFNTCFWDNWTNDNTPTTAYGYKDDYWVYLLALDESKNSKEYVGASQVTNNTRIMGSITYTCQ